MDDLLTIRTKLRSKATKLCNDLRSYREGDRKALDPEQLALKLHHVEKLQNEIQGVQTQLDKLGQADDSSYSQTMEDELFLGSRLLKRLERDDQARDKAESHIPTAYTELKTALSLKIPTFQGDVMKWAEFWELYVIAVHDNPKFAKVQKFVVLKSHLAGVALKAIQDIPVTGDGYTQAVEILRDRFDLPDVRKETLLRELLNMPSVRHNDLKAMRSLVDHLSAHTRALSSLGVTADSFSSLLLPVAKEKIPDDWRLIWARQESGNFSEFLAFLKREIRFRESARGAEVSQASSAQLLPMPAVARVLSTRRVLHTETQGHHRVDHRAEPLSADARWGTANSFNCERSPGVSVPLAGFSEPEPGRADNARQCDEPVDEMLEMTGSGHHGTEVDLPDTTLNENECKSPPTLKLLCGPSAIASQDKPNDPDPDPGCRGLKIATRIDEDERSSEGQSGPDAGHSLSLDVRTHGPDVDNSITPVDAGASSKGVMDGHEGAQFLTSVEAGASSKGVMDGPVGGNRIASVEAGASSKDVMQAGRRDGDTFASELMDGSLVTPVEAGVSSKGVMQAGCHDGDSLVTQLSTDSRQMGGVMKPERRSDVDGHCPAPGRETDGCHVDGGAAAGRKGPGDRCLPSGDCVDGPCYKPEYAFDDPTWVRDGPSSHDRWDPGGHLFSCPPSA